MKPFVVGLALLVVYSSALAEKVGDRFESLLGFTLNAATLDDVTARLGAAKRFDVPEGHHEFAVCYQLPDTTTVVMFSSDGEFGGPEAELLGISVLEENENQFPCSPIAASQEVLDFYGVALGLTEKQFRMTVGEPLQPTDNGDLVRFFESERQLTPEELKRISVNYPGIYDRPVADVTHSVWGSFKDGQLVAFGCWRMETL
ncbi:MAG: hypothetical protein ABL989_11070 [Gammaproteobacteria bacterium]